MTSDNMCDMTEQELLYSKYREFISVADRVRTTSPNGYKLREFMDKYCR